MSSLEKPFQKKLRVIKITEKLKGNTKKKNQSKGRKEMGNRGIKIRMAKQKINRQMVDLNPLMLIISLKVSILNTSLKGRDSHTALE